MAALGNVIWFLLIGWWTPLLWLLLAGLFAITIIGLPLARACLEFAKLTAFPFGKAIIRDTALLGNNNVSAITKTINIVLGIIWFPFGLLLTIAYFALAIACFVSIIGIPFGIAFMRIGKFVLFPMGARVVSKEQAHATANAQNINTSRKCRQCGKIHFGSSCPYCGSTLFEETNQSIDAANSPTAPIDVNNNLDSTKDGLAIASLISGIIGLSLVPVIGSIVGLITGVSGLKSTKRNLAIAGLVISIIGLLIGIVGSIYFIPLLFM